MLRYLRDWKLKRNRRKDKVEEWEMEVIETILTKILPESEPFYYDSSFSFLQPSRYNVRNPIRVSIFLPTYPLAIDVIGAYGRKDFSESNKYITRDEWDTIQFELAWKSSRLLLHKCPYLVIRDTDPVDVINLKNSISNLTTKSLRP